LSLINKITAREILDSRGHPTVEVDVFCEDGSWGRASVPAGASIGQYEALEKRDNDPNRYNGLGILNAIKNINSIIAPKIIGLEAIDQKQIDETLIYLDSTPNKSNLGANATLGISLAVSRAAAQSLKMPLYIYLAKLAQTETLPYHIPVPFVNIINGGKHGNDNLDFQEFMIVPLGAQKFSEAIMWCSEVSLSLADLLKSEGQSTNFGDEGGFAPEFETNEKAIETIITAIKNAGYQPGNQISIALDIAASEFYENNKYHLVKEGKDYSSDGMIIYYQELLKKYPIFSIEDGLSDSDWESWTKMTLQLGDQIKIIGDDLFATNNTILQKGISQKSANAILIKPNQVGTLLETIQTVRMAQNTGFLTIISHRSGETEDVYISDLAVAVNSFGIKTGGMNRSERLAKYNQLIRIEEALGSNSRYGLDIKI